MNMAEEGAVGPNPVEVDNNADQNVGNGEKQNDLWIWHKVLLRIRVSIRELEKHLDTNAVIHHDIQRAMMKFQRMRQRQRNDAFRPEQMAQIVEMMATALNRLDQLAINLADHSKGFYHIRRCLSLLEGRISRDAAEEGAIKTGHENPIKEALEYMNHVDKILNRITIWDEEDENNA